MSHQDFDRMTRSIAVGVSRRQALKLLAGGVFGAAGAAVLGTRSAEACTTHGEACKEQNECCSGLCRDYRCYCMVTGQGNCERNEECCTRICQRDLIDGVKYCVCSTPGLSCNHNANCCSNNCVNGVCK